MKSPSTFGPISVILVKNCVGLALLLGLSIFGVENFVLKQNYPALLFGFFYNILIGGLIFLLGLFRIFRLPADYYRQRPFEKGGGLYRALGVEDARTLFKVVGFIRFDSHRSSLQILRDMMVFAEKNHAIAFFLNVFALIYAASRSQWELALSLLFFNCLMNGYPIMVQRYNRPRLDAILERDARSQRFSSPNNVST